MKFLKLWAASILLFWAVMPANAETNFNPQFNFAFSYGALKALDAETAVMFAKPEQAVMKYCGKKSRAATTWVYTVTGSFYVMLSQTMMELAIAGGTTLGDDAPFIRDLAKAVDARGRTYIDGGINHLPVSEVNKRIKAIDQRTDAVFKAAKAKLKTIPSDGEMRDIGKKAIHALNIDAEFKKTCDAVPLFESMEK